MSRWEHTKRATEELRARNVTFSTEEEAKRHIDGHNLEHAKVTAIPGDKDMSVRFIIEPMGLPFERPEPPKRMTFGEAMQNMIQPSSMVTPVTSEDHSKEFIERVNALQQEAMRTALSQTIPSVDPAIKHDINGNAIDETAVKVRAGYLSLLSKLSVEDAGRINPDTLLKATLAYCDTEATIAGVLSKMNRQPTMNAVHRTVDFMLSTTQAIDLISDFDGYVDTEALRKQRDKKPYQQSIDNMLIELNNLIFVSKARVIMDDYPEAISLSVQLLPSISEEDTPDAMGHFESILQRYKPKELIELEVSITNKVVY